MAIAIFAAMFNIRLSAKYLWHRITANNRHGLHSPFVYRLVDKVIYEFCAKDAYADLKSAYIRFRNDGNFTATPYKVWQLLYRLVADAHPATYMFSGIGNMAVQHLFQLAAPGAAALHPEHNGWRQPVAADVIFVDAAITGAVESIVEQCLPFVHPGSMLIIYQLYRQPQGENTFQQLRAHPLVTITIDLFWLQLVYFRTGQVKEHFKVRY